MNTQNGHSSEEERWTEEEENNASGYQPNATELLERQFLLNQEEEPQERRDESENPWVRGLVVLLVVGSGLFVGFIVWIIFFTKKPEVAPQASVTPSPAPNNSVASDRENQRLKAELALRDQSIQVRQQPQLPPTRPIPKPTSTPIDRTPSPPRIIREPAPPPRIIREPAPPPRIIREPAPTVAQRPTPSVIPHTDDPFARWNQLAAVGEEEETSSSAPSDTARQTTSQPIGSQGGGIVGALSNTPGVELVASRDTRSILPVTIGGSSGSLLSSTSTETPGEQGILSGTPTESGSDVSPRPLRLQVPMGASAQAAVSVPMVWAEEDKSGRGRFAVELTESVMTADSQVALPAGTVFIAETRSVAKPDLLVDADVVAVVYKDSSGQILSQSIPVGSIAIRGESDGPLVASEIRDRGAAIARQDILIGALGAAGTVGQVINQPNSQSTTTITGGLDTSQVQISNSRHNILAAALEGFFLPMSQRLSARADLETKKIENSPSIATLKKGTKCTILFNVPLVVNR